MGGLSSRSPSRRTAQMMVKCPHPGPLLAAPPRASDATDSKRRIPLGGLSDVNFHLMRVTSEYVWHCNCCSRQSDRPCWTSRANLAKQAHTAAPSHGGPPALAPVTVETLVTLVDDSDAPTIKLCSIPLRFERDGLFSQQILRVDRAVRRLSRLARAASHPTASRGRPI